MTAAPSHLSSELADLRRDVIELREWKAAILGKCKASDGFDSLKWGGDKEGWGFVHYFIDHLQTRALHAETILAEQARDDMALHPLSEIREWDEALAVLGIQDSDQTPADAIRERDAEIERLRGVAQEASGRVNECDLADTALQIGAQDRYALWLVLEWWDALPPSLRQDIEGSGNEPGCIAHARTTLAVSSTLLSTPWDAHHNRSYEPVETAAKEIYDFFEYKGAETKPAWVPGGNSLMQDEARICARRQLREAGHTPEHSSTTRGPAA